MLAPEVALRLRLERRDASVWRTRERFGAILGPFSLLGLIVEPAARAACLARCREHLTPGGVALFDLFVPRASTGSAEAPHRFVSSFPLDRTGHVVEKETLEWHDGARGVDHVTYRYLLRSAWDGREIECYDVVFELARLTPDQVDQELEAAGLTVTERFGDYRGGPFSPRAERYLVEAQAL